MGAFNHYRMGQNRQELSGLEPSVKRMLHKLLQ